MSCVVIDPSRHAVKETPIAKLFRRTLKFEDIFTYFNTDTGQWILAYWVNKRGRLADEIEDLGSGFEEVNEAFIEMIRICWKPVDWKDKKKALARQEASDLQREQEKVIVEQDRFDWLKKKMKDKTPLPYAFESQFSGGDVS